MSIESRDETTLAMSSEAPIPRLRTWDHGLFDRELVHLKKMPRDVGAGRAGYPVTMLPPMPNLESGTVEGTKLALTEMYQKIESRWEREHFLIVRRLSDTPSLDFADGALSSILPTSNRAFLSRSLSLRKRSFIIGKPLVATRIRHISRSYLSKIPPAYFQSSTRSDWRILPPSSSP